MRHFAICFLIPGIAAAAPEQTLRVIAGFEQSGASGAGSTQRSFFDLFREWTVSTRPARGGGIKWWGDIRLSSAPRQRSEPLVRLISTAPGELARTPAHELAQAAEFLTGLRVPLTRPKRNAAALSVVVAAGATGLLNPDSGLAPLTLPADPVERARFERLYGRIPAGKQAVVFVPSDRDRYFRQAWAGIRAQASNAATVDVLAGRNEAITRRGAVLRFEVFHPVRLRGRRLLYVFAAAQLATARPRESQRILLAPHDTSVAVTDPRVWQLPQTAVARDQYRIGIGFHFGSGWRRK